jgi:cytochrome c oxidase subunit 1
MMASATAIDVGQARRIMWMHLNTGLAIFASMALVGFLMRAEQARLVVLSPTMFYELMTLHGTLMILAVVMGSMGILWYLLRAEGYMDERVASWAYAIMTIGVLTIFVSVFAGGFAGSWTYLSPLPFINPSWAQWSIGAFLIGLALETIGWSVWCIQVLGLVLSKYGGFRGAFGWDVVFRSKTVVASEKEAPSLPALAALVVSLSGLITAADGTTIGVALVVHWIDRSVSLDPLWAKNLTYFFGHELANLAMYMAVAVVIIGLPRYTGRNFKVSPMWVIAWWATLVFVALAAFHHFYYDFVQFRPFQYVGEFASYLESLPVAAVTIFSGLALVYRSAMRWTMGSLFIYAGLVGWVVGGIGALIDATIPFNMVLHNTLWVPAHFHSYLLEGVLLFILGWAFMMLEERSGKTTSQLMRWVIGIGVFGGGALFLVGFYVAGANGVPRREAEQPAPGPHIALWATLGAFVLLLGLVAALVEAIRVATPPRTEAIELAPALPARQSANESANPT